MIRAVTIPGLDRVRIAWKSLALVLVATGGCQAEPGAGAAVTITVDSTQRFQTFTGWEATLDKDQAVYRYSDALRTRVIDSAATVGITRLRLEIMTRFIQGDPGARSGAQGVRTGVVPLDTTAFDWTRLDRQVREWVLPLKERVEANGDVFTLNVCYVGFDKGYLFEQKQPERYAAFMSAVLRRLRDEHGIEPGIWEVRLEPNIDPPITGTEVGRLLAAAAERARREGFAVGFAAPSTSDPKLAVPYVRDILEVAGTKRFLTEISYHRYWPMGPSTLEDIHALADSIGAGTAMLEFIGAGVAEVYDDLTRGHVSAWAQYVLEYPSLRDGGAHLLIVDTATSTARLSETGRYLRRFFEAIRPGAIRIGAREASGLAKPVAFQDRSGQHVVVANVSGGARLRVVGLAPGVYRARFTTENAEGESAPHRIAVGETYIATIPAAGVLSIVPADVGQ